MPAINDLSICIATENGSGSASSKAQAIYRAGEQTVVRVLLEMDARIHALETGAGTDRPPRCQRTASQTSGRPVGQELSQQQQAASTDGFQKPAPKSLREKSARPSGGCGANTRDGREARS